MTGNTILSFDEFCEVNALVEEEKDLFQKYLEKTFKDSAATQSRNCTTWLNIFNEFCDKNNC